MKDGNEVYLSQSRNRHTEMHRRAHLKPSERGNLVNITLSSQTIDNRDSKEMKIESFRFNLN